MIERQIYSSVFGNHEAVLDLVDWEIAIISDFA